MNSGRACGRVAGGGDEADAPRQHREGSPLQGGEPGPQQYRCKGRGGQDLEGLGADLKGNRVQVAGCNDD